MSCSYTLGVSSVCLFALVLAGYAENKTDVSLKWKDKPQQESEISSESGDLFETVAHHGPAVENEWMGIRIYFDKKCALDAYNKKRRGLELAEAAWYPTEEQQKEGWGADQYKAGTTVGLGGVRLWDGEKVIALDPVTMRTARVRKEANYSQIEMLSEGVPYKGTTVDVMLRVTAFSGFRDMKVEAFAFCDEPVEFVTGINYWETTSTFEGENYVGTWGVHPEDVAATVIEIGGAVIFDPEDIAQHKKTADELLLISNPTHYLSSWIVSGCEAEPSFSGAEDFEQYVREAYPMILKGKTSETLESGE
ncbi:MAG: DUF4861 family protein [Pontiellaceae bacterium]|nr:DUF4861 family protein [Pontiellaceae bacterium]